MKTKHLFYHCCCCCCCVTSVVSGSVWPHRWQPTRLHRLWDSPGKNTGVGCHFLLQCMKVKVKSLSKCPTPSDPMDCSLPGSFVHGIFQAKSTGVGCHCLLSLLLLFKCFWRSPRSLSIYSTFLFVSVFSLVTNFSPLIMGLIFKTFLFWRNLKLKQCFKDNPKNFLDHFRVSCFTVECFSVIL